MFEVSIQSRLCALLASFFVVAPSLFTKETTSIETLKSIDKNSKLANEKDTQSVLLKITLNIPQSERAKVSKDTRRDCYAIRISNAVTLQIKGKSSYFLTPSVYQTPNFKAY